MTYDKQDLLLDLRRLAAKNDDDPEANHEDADEALIRFIDDEHIDDEHIATAYDAIMRWYS